MPLSDVLEAMQNPEAYIYNRVKHGELDAEQRLRENLYATGYEGQTPTGITEPRGFFGSIGQSIGLLDSPEPRELTPYERYITEQGRLGKTQSNLGIEKEQLNISNAKNRIKQGALVDALKAYEATGVSSPEMLKDYPDYLDDYKGFQVKTKKQEHYDAQDRRLKRMAVLAGIKAQEARLSGEYGGIDLEGKKQALNLERMRKVLNNPINVALKRQYEFYFGDEHGTVEGAFDKAKRSRDPLEISKLIEGDQFGGGYRRFYQQLHDALKYGGVDEDAIPNLVFVPPGSNEPFRDYGQPYPDAASAAQGRKGVSDEAWGQVMDSGVLADSPGSRATGTGGGQIPFNAEGYGPQGLRKR